MKGESVDDLMMENPATFHEYGRTLAKIEDLRMSKIVRTEMTQGMYLVGATGTGKSFRAKKDTIVLRTITTLMIKVGGTTINNNL